MQTFLLKDSSPRPPSPCLATREHNSHFDRHLAKLCSLLPCRCRRMMRGGKGGSRQSKTKLAHTAQGWTSPCSCVAPASNSTSGVSSTTFSCKTTIDTPAFMHDLSRLHIIGNIYSTRELMQMSKRCHAGKRHTQHAGQCALRSGQRFEETIV